MGILPDFLQRPGQAETPIVTTARARMVDADVEAEQRGNHQRGVPRVGGKQRLYQFQPDPLGKGRPGTVVGNWDAGEF